MESTATKALAPTATKALATEDVFAQFDRIYDSIARRAFEIFAGDGYGLGHDLEHWRKAESELLHRVHMNVSESDEAVSVTAEVPGFEANDLEIKLEPTRLTVSGKRKRKRSRKRARPLIRNTAPTKSCASWSCRLQWTRRRRRRS